MKHERRVPATTKLQLLAGIHRPAVQVATPTAPHIWIEDGDEETSLVIASQ